MPPSSDALHSPDLMGAFPLVQASRAAGHRSRKLATSLLAQIGLHPGQEVVLLELLTRNELNQVELATALDIEQPSVTGIVAKLERAGLVTRRAAGREKRVALTDDGREAARGALAVYAEMEALLNAGITQTQTTSMLAALRLVSENAQAGIQARRS